MQEANALMGNGELIGDVELPRWLLRLLRLGRRGRAGSGSRFGNAGILPNEKCDEGNGHERTEDAERIQRNGVAPGCFLLSEDGAPFANVDGVGEPSIRTVCQRDARQMECGGLCGLAEGRGGLDARTGKGACALTGFWSIHVLLHHVRPRLHRAPLSQYTKYSVLEFFCTL